MTQQQMHGVSKKIGAGGIAGAVLIIAYWIAFGEEWSPLIDYTPPDLVWQNFQLAFMGLVAYFTPETAEIEKVQVPQ